jgi:hypothetical protein
MKSFTHEQKRKLSQEEYVAIVSLTARYTRPWRFAFVVVIGIVSLFWTYTIGLGIVLLIVTSIAFVAPHLLRGGAAAAYRRSPHLREELTYAVSDRGLSVGGSDLRCQFAWRHLSAWREHDGWLILTPNEMPQLLLSVQQLREAGVYDDVLALARQHATDHGRPVPSRFRKGNGRNFALSQGIVTD